MSLGLIFNLDPPQNMTFVGNAMMGGAAVFGLLTVITVTDIVSSYIFPSGMTMSEVLTARTGIMSEVV